MWNNFKSSEHTKNFLSKKQECEKMKILMPSFSSIYLQIIAFEFLYTFFLENKISKNFPTFLHILPKRKMASKCKQYNAIYSVKKSHNLDRNFMTYFNFWRGHKI